MTAITQVQALCPKGVNACLNELDGHYPTEVNGSLVSYIDSLDAIHNLEEKYLSNAALQDAYVEWINLFTEKPSPFALATSPPLIRCRAFLGVAMQYLGYGSEKVTAHETAKN